MIETNDHSWKRVPNVMLQDTRLRLSDVAVFACLLDLCKDTLQVSVSCKEIAGRVNRTRKYVMQSLKMLEQFGYIERKAESGGVSTYFLAELVPAEKKRKRKPTPRQQPEPDELLPGQLAFFSEPDPGRQSDDPGSSGVKTRWGKYRHVELTIEGYHELVAMFSERIVKLYIQKIDDYCELYGKSYENYYLAIKRWVDEDKLKNPKGFEKQKNRLTDEELKGYLSLVNRFKDD